MYMLKMCSVSNAFTERINLTKLAVWPADEMLNHPSNTHLQTKMNRFCRTRELLPEGDGPMTTFGCGHGKIAFILPENSTKRFLGRSNCVC